MIFVSSLYCVDTIKLYVICLFCWELAVSSQHPPWGRCPGLRGPLCVWPWQSLCFTWNVVCKRSISGLMFKVLFHPFNMCFSETFVWILHSFNCLYLVNLSVGRKKYKRAAYLAKRFLFLKKISLDVQYRGL